MALNSAYFQPFSFGGDDTSPSYDPSTDDELDWMQYAGRNAYAAKGGGRPQGARPLPTSGSAQQKTQTALVPQPADDYLNPPPSASSSAYLNNTLNVAQDYLNGVQQPNPGGGAVTSRIVGGGDGGHQAEYLAALNALPEWQTANAAADFLKARSGKYTDPRVVENKLALISQNRALAGQRLQAERPDLFKQRQPDTLVGAKGEYMIGEDGRLRPNPYYRPEAKPVPQGELAPTGRGTYALPTVNAYGDVDLKELPGMTGSMSPEQKAAADLEAERRKISLTGDQNVRVANVQGANALGVEGLRGKTAVQVATITGGDRVEAARVRSGRNDEYSKLQKDLDTERKNRDSLQKQRAQMLATVKDDDAMIATLENKPGADPALLDRLKRTRAAKLAANSTWGTTNDAYTKSMERIVGIQESMDRLRETPRSDDGLPSPGTSGDRTDAPVPKPSQIKPEAPDPASKVASPRRDVVPPPAQQTNGAAAGYPDAGQIQRAVARMRTSGEAGLKVKGTNYVIQPDGSVTTAR